jgi:hypothetical protein
MFACCVAALVLLGGQQNLFVSGTVVDDAGRPGAMIGAGSKAGESDKDGHFAVGVPPGPLKIRVSAAGYEPAFQEVTIKSDAPLFGLTVTLKRRAESATAPSVGTRTSDAITEGELRAMTTAAMEEWRGFNDNIVKTLDYKAKERWGDLLVEPIPLWNTPAISIGLITPYQLSHWALRGAEKDGAHGQFAVHASRCHLGESEAARCAGHH